MSNSDELSKLNKQGTYYSKLRELATKLSSSYQIKVVDLYGVIISFLVEETFTTIIYDTKKNKVSIKKPNDPVHLSRELSFDLDVEKIYKELCTIAKDFSSITVI